MDFRDYLSGLIVSGGSATEPSADMRMGAHASYEVFRSHVDAGFTEDQAMQIVMNIHSAAIIANLNDKDGE
jgi:hypothetical protein